MARAIERINLEMARVLGTEGLLLGGDGRGSLALSKDKSHNFSLIIDSTLQELADSAKQDLVAPLFELNGWDLDDMPSPKTEATRYRDVEEVTRALQDMAQAGAILAPDDPVIKEVRGLLGLSDPIRVISEVESDLPGPDNRTVRDRAADAAAGEGAGGE